MIALAPAGARDLDRWDDLVESSVNGTLFHRRDFLAYHGDRFTGAERYLVLRDGEERLALLSLALSEDNGECVARSPYGGSYGGFVFLRQPTYDQAHASVGALVEWLRGQRVAQCTITPPIACCATVSMDTVAFCLLEQGFRSHSRDVSSVFPLRDVSDVEAAVSSRARGSLRRALAAGVTTAHRAPIDDFWRVMSTAFEQRGRRATHTLAEFADLAQRLPRRVWADVAYLDGEPIAGVGHFVVARHVDSSFYFCQDPRHQALQGLTLLVIDGLRRAKQQGFSWFDFGTSSLGGVARPHIFRFKESFSRSGQLRETFVWSAAA